MSDPEIDWQAWATLATGIMAVVGAVIVGLRQVKISERQTAILDRQAGIEEAKLRAELFDRRLETFAVAAEFLAHIGTRKSTDAASEDRWQRFWAKLRESQFLFDRKVYDALSLINQEAVAMQSDLDSIRNAGNEGDEFDNAWRAIHDRTEWQLSTLEKMSEVFEEDLKINLGLR